jgi:hypothetical protein
MWRSAMVQRTRRRLALIFLDFAGFRRANGGRVSDVTADT